MPDQHAAHLFLGQVLAALWSHVYVIVVQDPPSFSFYRIRTPYLPSFAHDTTSADCWVEAAEA